VGAVEEISDWNLREQLEVNFFGTANIIRCVLPGMRKRRSGHIINITGLSITKCELG
jgi:NAD(P)-dependent dehydrogenase (short-subunit alcohol dehydrogenase family)